MKEYIIFFLLFLYSVGSYSQWQPDTRLTYDSGTCLICLNNARGIAATGSFVHITWCDERDGNREIYYKRSTNSGVNWGPDIRLTNDSAVSYRPSIAVIGSLVHVVWCDSRDGNFEIYYRRSTNNGLDWGQAKRLTYTPHISWAPSLALNGSNLYLVWEEAIDGNEEIFYKHSSNNGLNWEEDIRLTYDYSGSFYPSIAVSGTTIHVVWYDFTIGNRSIFYKRSTNNGFTWNQSVKLTSLQAESYNPSVAVSNQTVHIVWHDTRYGNEEIYYIRSTNGGSTWGQEVRLTYSTGVSCYPSIFVSGSNVHLTWYDNTDGNYEIFYGRSKDGGLNWQLNKQLTFDTAGSYRPTIAVSDSIVHIAWNDYRDGDWEVYYKRNPTGNPIGINKLSTDIPKNYELEQNFPNPFNQSTKIRYSCPKNGNIKIKICDIKGCEILTLVEEEHQPGQYEIRWNAYETGSGIYLCLMYSNNKLTSAKKMILIK